MTWINPALFFYGAVSASTATLILSGCLVYYAFANLSSIAPRRTSKCRALLRRNRFQLGRFIILTFTLRIIGCKLICSYSLVSNGWCQWASRRREIALELRQTAKLATTFVSSVADKTITRLLAGIGRTGSGALGSAITAKAMNFSWNGAIDSGGIIVAGAGLIIGVIAHAGITYHDRAKRAKASPYRFLTTLESAGVLCRY